MLHGAENYIGLNRDVWINMRVLVNHGSRLPLEMTPQ